MKNILFVNACVRPKSRTHFLAENVLQKMGGTVEELNLEAANILPLDWASLQVRDAFVLEKDFSDPMFQYAKQFAAADEIVIAAPYWELTFPAMVRIYFEVITVCGLTFMYTPDGQSKGLCNAKKIVYVTTAGGPIQPYNLGYDFVKALAREFYDIPEVLCFQAEKLDIAGADVDGILKETLKEIETCPSFA